MLNPSPIREIIRRMVFESETEMRLKHATVEVSGYKIPLIGIPKSATQFQCQKCGSKFDRPDKVILTVQRFLCEKCRKKK